eukprot:m.464393 g.464393  ORF g.464393 m.464393 type:complete len:110 (-) comp21618_c0_seq3:106-435(-)
MFGSKSIPESTRNALTTKRGSKYHFTTTLSSNGVNRSPPLMRADSQKIDAPIIIDFCLADLDSRETEPTTETAIPNTGKHFAGSFEKIVKCITTMAPIKNNIELAILQD